MSRVIPTWSSAQLIVGHGSLSVGVFPSTKPWMPRHKERRFLAVAPGTADPDQTPTGGSVLPSLHDGVNHGIEERDFVVIAGEADGCRSIGLHEGGAGWTTIVAADAWVAVGPRATAPQRVEIGPHMLECPHLRLDVRAVPSISEDERPTVEFRFKDPE
jgi:hypothetical protein